MHFGSGLGGGQAVPEVGEPAEERRTARASAGSRRGRRAPGAGVLRIAHAASCGRSAVWWRSQSTKISTRIMPTPARAPRRSRSRRARRGRAPTRLRRMASSSIGSCRAGAGRKLARPGRRCHARWYARPAAMGDLSVDTRIEGEGGLLPRAAQRGRGASGARTAAILAASDTRCARPAPRRASRGRSRFAAHFVSLARASRPVDDRGPSPCSAAAALGIAARLAAPGRPRRVLEAIVRTAAAGEGLVHDAATAPAGAPARSAPPDMETVFAGEPGPPFPFWNNIECRPPAGLALQEPRLRRSRPRRARGTASAPTATFDDPFVDAGRLLVLLDVLPWRRRLVAPRTRRSTTRRISIWWRGSTGLGVAIGMAARDRRGAHRRGTA